MIQTNFQLSMAATAYTPWIDVRTLLGLSIQTDCGDVNDPVGVITLEASNDIPTVLQEKENGTTPANSAAAKVASAITAATAGTAWTTGYDGVGAKASIYGAAAASTGSFAFVRLKYLRTSGGAGDTLNVRVFGKDQL